MLFKRDRLRCSTCGRFVTVPKDVPAGYDIEIKCSLGHSLTYHSPATYYVQAKEITETRPDGSVIIYPVGDDNNDGLTPMTPLKTIAKAVEKCVPHDVVLAKPGVMNES